jgi:hypothetical protein
VKKGLTFDAVREIGLKLPSTEAATSWGSPCLKVDGRMFCCIAINKSAEPNSLVLRCDFAARDELIEEQPDIYYTADHYLNYPCVLVRLSRVHRDALEDLVRMAHRYVSSQRKKRSRITKTRRPTKVTKHSRT